MSHVPEHNDDGLDRLSTRELHDLAVSYAKRHGDARFFWRLSEILPAAETAAGERDEAAADVLEPGAHIGDVTDSGRGETADMLRPFFLDYLTSHGITAP
ncbi:MAG TPA: hypothetical protein VI006_19360 [Solirubrobacteraceae bacterium]